MIKIVILGYGRMGHEVELACQTRNIDTAVIESFTALEAFEFNKDDVVIEFTQAPNCLDNFRYLIQNKVPVVTGTTGWHAEEDHIRAEVEQSDSSFLFANNFSIGVHIFWNLIQKAAHIFDTQSQYDVYGMEMHHPNKKDAPSGTARHTAKILLENLSRKDALVENDNNRSLEPNELNFVGVRGGYQYGEHIVTFDGPDDLIEIKHHAKNRQGFANGAIDCALWLKNKTGYFSIEDYMKEILV